MLSYLDTVIGFAVVMLGISLLITILTQMVSSLFNHRGGNLLWGLRTLFANINPTRFPHLTAEADSVAKSVLTHCLISDSWFSNNRVASAVAGKVPLLHRLFARFRLASAIRPEELTDILRHLAENALAGQPVAADLLVLSGAGNPSTAGAPLAAAAAAAGTLGGPAPLMVQAAVDTVRETAARLEDWFNSTMDRVSQKFATYMRAWTVVFACAIAFGTGLNTVQLMTDLYTNGALREKLVGVATPLTATAQTVLSGDAAANGSLQAQAANVAAVRGQFSGVFDVLQFHWPRVFSWNYFFGVAITAGLLSLGAPFWFNALKSMANLRPILASKQASEQAADAA